LVRFGFRMTVSRRDVPEDCTFLIMLIEVFLDLSDVRWCLVNCFGYEMREFAQRREGVWSRLGLVSLGCTQPNLA
jgi:hypothetical protein